MGYCGLIHQIHCNSTSSAKEYAMLYLNEIARLHGIPLSIISNRGAQVPSHFWRSFQKGLGTQVKLSTTFHPQMDDPVQLTFQTPKIYVSDCVIAFKASWNDHLSLIEFSYNNSYYSSISMEPLRHSIVEDVGLRLGGLRLVSLYSLVSR